MSALLIVPCYNEAARWDPAYWVEVTNSADVDVLFVNDGSTDGTLEALNAAAANMGARVLDLARNGGKAEAVRQGLLAGWGSAVSLIGYLDADGAFPATEVGRMVRVAQRRLSSDDQSPAPEYDAVWSARVLMAGRDIQRHASRHYLGRVITTVVAPWHGYAIYDTQSGYKVFRKESSLLACLQEPFQTRWFPDIELLQRWRRLNGGPMRVWEEPVSGWHDVAGSKMNVSQYRQIIKDLVCIRGSRT